MYPISAAGAAGGLRSEYWLRSWLPLIAAYLLTSLTGTPAQTPFPVRIEVRADRPLGSLRHIWRFFGADEPNYATMKDGQKLLADFGRLRPREVYFRAHNLLTSGDGTPALKWGSTDVYQEDKQGNPIYNWRVLDRIFDAYLERDVRPYVQIGFMPKALSTQPEPYRHSWRPGFPYDRVFTGWACPPKDYEKWGELVFQWVAHCVERYGREEAETWYWQTWNEANIGGPDRLGYWRGSPQEFHKLHDYAIEAVRRALPNARVGGPDAAGSGGDWTRRFLEHCLRGTNYVTGEIGTPIDFVSFHAKGSPTHVDGHVRMGIANQLRAIDDGFSIVASFPELRGKPVIIGESDPEGCAACQGPRYSYRNGTMYSSYTAASFARKQDLADRHGVNFEGALTWAFTFEDQPYFAGFRQLASCGIPLPVFNVFRMLSKMSGERVAVESTGAVPLDDMLQRGVRENPDVGAFASLDPTTETVAVMVWHYHDDDLSGPAAAVELLITGLPFSEGTAEVTHYRIDEDHSNAYAMWQRMGSPIAPSQREYDRLQEASDLAKLSNVPEIVTIQDKQATVRFELPRRGVSLLLLQ